MGTLFSHVVCNFPCPRFPPFSISPDLGGGLILIRFPGSPSRSAAVIRSWLDPHTSVL